MDKIPALCWADLSDDADHRAGVRPLGSVQQAWSTDVLQNLFPLGILERALDGGHSL